MPIESQQQAMQIFKTGAAQRTKTETSTPNLLEGFKVKDNNIHSHLQS